MIVVIIITIIISKIPIIGIMIMTMRSIQIFIREYKLKS
jgi:hypothetical protein